MACCVPGGPTNLIGANLDSSSIDPRFVVEFDQPITYTIFRAADGRGTLTMYRCELDRWSLDNRSRFIEQQTTIRELDPARRIPVLVEQGIQNGWLTPLFASVAGMNYAFTGPYASALGSWLGSEQGEWSHLGIVSGAANFTMIMQRRWSSQAARATYERNNPSRAPVDLNKILTGERQAENTRPTPQPYRSVQQSSWATQQPPWPTQTTRAAPRAIAAQPSRPVPIPVPTQSARAAPAPARNIRPAQPARTAASTQPAQNTGPSVDFNYFFGNQRPAQNTSASTSKTPTAASKPTPKPAPKATPKPAPKATPKPAPTPKPAAAPKSGKPPQTQKQGSTSTAITPRQPARPAISNPAPAQRLLAQGPAATTTASRQPASATGASNPSRLAITAGSVAQSSTQAPPRRQPLALPAPPPQPDPFANLFNRSRQQEPQREYAHVPAKSRGRGRGHRR